MGENQARDRRGLNTVIYLVYAGRQFAGQLKRLWSGERWYRCANGRHETARSEAGTGHRVACHCGLVSENGWVSR